jgi:hypothetical protein
MCQNYGIYVCVCVCIHTCLLKIGDNYYATVLKYVR